MNRSKCSLLPFDCIYRPWLLLLSEVERKSLYSAIPADGPFISKILKSEAVVVLSVNESISNIRNQSKCSIIAFDHIYRTWMVLLSEVEWKSLYSSVAADDPFISKIAKS